MPTFQIGEYTVQVTQSGANPSWRSLALTSVPYAHGIRYRATLFFFEAAPSSLGSVHNVDQPNFDGHTVYASFRKADFADAYDLLRSEDPVNLIYGYSHPGVRSEAAG